MKRKKKTSFVDKPKYGFIKKVMLFSLAVTVLAFNGLVKVDIKASSSTDAITIENLLRAHNEYRAEMGLSQLRLNTLLNISAGKKGEAMLNTNCWSHYCPPNKSPWDFFDESEYDYVFAGENLAEGYYNIGDVMQAWLNSKTHRDNIVKSEFTEVGFAILYGSYLNNSNNLLVVVHFGSRSQGSVLSDLNPAIEITTPQNNTSISSSELDVAGTVNGFDKVQIFNNNNLSGEAQISGGIFTYRIKQLSEGSNTISADGTNSSGFSLTSNKVNVNYAQNIQQVSEEQSEFLNTDNGGLQMSLENRNLVNLGFIIFLAVIFLIDIILVSRTSAISSKKSFSHYHLGLIVLVALIILIGGFAGQIQTGLSV